MKVSERIRPRYTVSSEETIGCDGCYRTEYVVIDCWRGSIVRRRTERANADEIAESYNALYGDQASWEAWQAAKEDE